MGKKKDTKTAKIKKKRRNPLALIESKFPDIPISLYIIVPLAVGTVLGVNLTNNIPLGVLCGLILTGVVWFGKEYVPEPPPALVLSYTPDDIVMNIFDKTWFVTAVPADPNRPEAYSVDGQRWSHKLELSTEYGDTDVFILRGSLVTGESWLEYIEDESSHHPDFWQNDSNEGNSFIEETTDSVDDNVEIDYSNEDEHFDEQSESNTSGDDDNFSGLDGGDYFEPNTLVVEENKTDSLLEDTFENSDFSDDNTGSIISEHLEEPEQTYWDTKEDSETEFSQVLGDKGSDAEENFNTAPKNS